MPRCLSLVLACFVSWNAAHAAMIEREDFPDGHRTALAIDLSNERSVRGHVLALSSGTSALSFLELPFRVKNFTSDERHVVFAWQQPQATIVSFAARPSRSTSVELAGFEPVFAAEGGIDALARNVQTGPQDPNLYFVQEGLQRLFLLRLPAARDIRLDGTAGSASGELKVAGPDLVAVRLPTGFIGRTFASGRMHEPTPIKTDSVVLFSAKTEPSRLFRIRYELPQPHWVETVVRLGLKFAGMLLPPMLIAWTSADKINVRRFKRSVWIVAAVYALIYGSLIGLTLYTGGGMLLILEDIGFAAATAFLAWLTFYLTRRDEPPPPGALVQALV